MKKRRATKIIGLALGDCKALYSQCLYTEWFDLSDPSQKGETESVGAVWKYLSDLGKGIFSNSELSFHEYISLGPEHVHRSCSMDYIHYPIEIVTTQGQGEVKNGSYIKKPHEIVCVNNEKGQSKPAPPYFWNADGVTCRDWKIRYCCESMWGTPALYKLVSENAKKVGNRVPKKISETDVFVDKPTKDALFDDCKWTNFMRFPNSSVQL